MKNKNNHTYDILENQKDVYVTTLKVIEELLNKKVGIDRAKEANHLLTNANRAFALEIKLAQVKNEAVRKVEGRDF